MKSKDQSKRKSKENNKQKDGCNSLVTNYESGIV
jgi:hypothetical protein